MRQALSATLALGLLVASIAAPPVQGQATGKFGISPGQSNIPDAQPGESYLRSVRVLNEFDTASTITVTHEGPAALWTVAEPASGFTIAPHAFKDVALTISVPDATGPGTRPGWVNFTTEPKGTSGGSGSNSVRFGAALVLNVTVGGEPREQLVWLSARVTDAVQGDAVHAFVRVRNDGNVVTTAQAAGKVLPFLDDEPILSEASGSADVVAGEESEVAVTFPAGLAVGQYRARLAAADFTATLEFKVALDGTPPAGELRSIVAGESLRAGRTGTLHARFANTGGVAIASATFHGEIRDGEGDLVATVSSSSMPVPLGENVTLDIAWTPARAGTYTLSGRVTYDGYESLPNEALLEVHPARVGGGSWLPWAVAALLLVAVVLVVLVLRQRRRTDRR